MVCWLHFVVARGSILVDCWLRVVVAWGSILVDCWLRVVPARFALVRRLVHELFELSKLILLYL